MTLEPVEVFGIRVGWKEITRQFRPMTTVLGAKIYESEHVHLLAPWLAGLALHPRKMIPERVGRKADREPGLPLALRKLPETEGRGGSSGG